ncbi:hypothetical protein Poly59_41060 [Rubripirellula reticaptiva]|uniref:Uncharacterized protein n=2 Tax=Rubripirellula reticaptiva TaxID=2528013 RepID=A0A5C6EPD1_9BACT|nr:hypothetical protein Poly59_41060 [Rubripirellula reticaptiva]
MDEAIERLTNEVQVLRESVDQLKTALEHAIRNGRIVVEFAEASANDRQRPSTLLDAKDIDDDCPIALNAEELDDDVSPRPPPPLPGDLF